MTNFERTKNMDTDELAAFIIDDIVNGITYCTGEECDASNNRCIDCVIAWLKQDAEYTKKEFSDRIENAIEMNCGDSRINSILRITADYLKHYDCKAGSSILKNLANERN